MHGGGCRIMYISDAPMYSCYINSQPNTPLDTRHNAEIQPLRPGLRPPHGHYVCLSDGLHSLWYYSAPRTTHRYPSLTGIGYDQGVFSGIVGNEDFLNVVHHPSAGILGIIVSIYNLGCFAGTIVSFVFSDKLGPRLSMWIAMAWVIVRLLSIVPA